MRGLESTCTLPCDSRKVSNAAKLGVCSASPNTAPAGFDTAKAPEATESERAAVSARSPLPAGPVPIAVPRGTSWVAVLAELESWPNAALLLKIDQLIPAWYSFDSV